MGTEQTLVPLQTVALRHQDFPSFLQRLQDALHCAEYSKAAQLGIRMACEEALVNGHKHGNGGDESKTVSVQYRVDDQEFSIKVEDQGEGFDPTSVPDPTLLENLEKPSGRGLFLMRTYMDEVRFLGNAVEMRRRRDA
ncbi:MAG: anti-sigma regulatory factor, serine/threonine protein kinase [Parcubacteria group bacterium Gr01-1014_38]|nr:MAG: anti-sigma regulatory factor, serine/threonine protein kinase [Parcubacteria group bacterium Gr01-1014_38]